MRAAIYARKSNEQNDVAEEQKSVTRQIEGARAFITSRGWSLDEAHVYSDDGVSGALFMGREHFQRMMRDAEAGAFEAVVMYDLDRFGRNARHTMDALNRLADLGVSIWDYSTGQALDLDSFEGETMTFMKARFAQQYRDQVRKHTATTMRRKAEQGLVTGGKVFGYKNERVAKGQSVRVILEEEAAVVRDIYQRAAAGEGSRTIAEALNRMGAPSPRAQQGRPSGWSATTVREVLVRPLYRGEIVYGKTRSVYGREVPRRNGRAREVAQIPTDESTWTRLPPDEKLRIISPELAARVDARRLDRRTRYFESLGQTNARAPEKAHGKYLLSGGMLICPQCGGHFEALKYPREEYACATRRRKPGTCTNPLKLPIAFADDVVLTMVEGEILGTKFIEELLSLVEQGERDDTTRLTADRDRLRGEVERLVRLVADGLASDNVASAIREREAEIARLEVRLRTQRPAPNIVRLRDALTQRAAEWKVTLREEPKVARLLLRRLIGPLVLTDDSQRPEWIDAEAEVKTGLLDGDVASPTG
jgi:DNA invertase Pin-like site-specific DNA recombinase